MLGKLGYEAFKTTEEQVGSMGKIIENISNAYSLGYKKGEVSFFETLTGEVAKHESKDFSQGMLRRTADLYDLALDGPGFFEVEMQNGQRAYTRAGRFKLTNEGELVTEEGYRVIPAVEPIGKPIEITNIESKEVGLNIKVTTPRLIIPVNLTHEILEDGTVNGINPQTNEKTKIGKINVVVFNNLQGLESIGKSYYLPTDASGPSLETEVGMNAATKVKQGFLEFGNVNVISEFMRLSQMKNLLSAQLKVLKVIDKVYEDINYTVSRSI